MLVAAKYLDAKLRSGGARGLDDVKLEALLNDVLYLFRFTQGSSPSLSTSSRPSATVSRGLATAMPAFDEPSLTTSLARTSLAGKDIFEAFYKRDLAKRLLLNKSASFDAERSMLLKLKDGPSLPLPPPLVSAAADPPSLTPAECGPGFTQKLEIMFKDMDLSADVMRAFSASSSSSGSPFDLSVSVLSQGNWPTYPPFPIALPPALTAARERFRAFYVAKHSGRALSWASGLDTVTLRAHFPASAAAAAAAAVAAGEGKVGTVRKELLVSLAQAVVLLLFNDPAEQGAVDDGTLSVEEIGAATQLGASAFPLSCSDPAGVPALLCVALTPPSVVRSQRRKSSRARCRASRAARCASSPSSPRAETSTRATASPSTRCVAVDRPSFFLPSNSKSVALT